MIIEAMKQALEALEYHTAQTRPITQTQDAIASLRQAIEQAEKQGQWGASSVTKPEYVAEQKEKTQRALDLMAENARELGLDYEPVQAEKQEPTYYLSHDGHLMTPSRAKFLGFPSDCMTALYTTPQPQQDAWKNAAIRLGEELSSFGPDGYYDMTAEQWLSWALDQQPNGKHSLPQPQREWVGLTDEERKEIHDEWRHKVCSTAWGYEKTIEAKLKEKNT